MIDIHSHILPGIDDGADSIEMTLEMLEMAELSGVTGIVATSHCNIPGMYDNYVSPAMSSLWNRVMEAKRRANFQIRLYRGMEVYAAENLPDLLKSRSVWTLQDTNRFLTEFAFDEDPDYCNRILRKCRGMGFQPVIAHPERYYFLQEDPGIAYEWCLDGYALQINKGSLLGRFGPREEETGISLIRHGLGACVASDAHGASYRTTDMTEVRHFLALEFGEEYMKLLLEENPYRILSGRELLGYEPIPY